MGGKGSGRKKGSRNISVGGSYTPYGSSSGYHTKIKRSGKPKYKRVKKRKKRKK